MTRATREARAHALRIDRGGVFRAYFARCGFCGYTVGTGQVARQDAAKQLDALGWRKSKAFGLLCARCGQPRPAEGKRRGARRGGEAT